MEITIEQLKSLIEAVVCNTRDYVMNNDGFIDDWMIQNKLSKDSWTKIENESDLPEQDGDYHIIINDKLRKGTYVKNNRWFVVGNDFPKTTEIHGITHYQKNNHSKFTANIGGCH